MATTQTTARLAEIALPDFGMPDTEPLLAADDLRRAAGAPPRRRWTQRGYDHLVVWADREHSANLAYLSGFDPRFEEAVLIVGRSGEPAVLVGNECCGHGRRRAAADAARVLPGLQPARASRATPPHHCPRSSRDEGISGDSRVGVVGWKTYATPRDDRGAGVPRRRAATC